MKFLDVLLNSHEVRKTIVGRAQEMRLPLKYVAKHIGMDFGEFTKRYLKADAIRGSGITEEQFLKIFDILGISVKHNIVINKEAVIPEHVQKWIDSDQRDYDRLSLL